MKSIAWINISTPSDDEFIGYEDDISLSDYDIIVFDPELPIFERIYFDAGGSCISIEGTQAFSKASAHWSRELANALKAGKTVFVTLNAHKQDAAAYGSTSPRKNERTYSTQRVNNYAVLPIRPDVRNSRGQSIIVKDPAFKGLYDAISETMVYRVVFEAMSAVRVTFAAKDGTPIGGVVRRPEWPGALVLLPYFDFEGDGFSETSEKGQAVWSNKALKAYHAVVAQLIAVDRALKSSADLTPPPTWLNEFAKPKAITDTEAEIADIDAQVEKLRQQRQEQVAHQNDLIEYSRLLYETGAPLEKAIEKVLRLLDYSVETLRVGDLEIDHVIVGPRGNRMIGESEGKDNNAIDISKFRQLETNIGEDFEREEVTEHAKGLLFGNGFRLTAPAGRKEQFTAKCLTNARRFGAGLVRTADLYKVAVHLLDYPDDETFKDACRAAIENTVGDIVQLPDPPPGG